MYYHGTKNDNAEIIVKTQQMHPSVGDHQWLGDGCYFYCEEEYAFRWILIKYTGNFKNEFATDYSGIFDKYAIISAELNITPERLFSMDDIHNSLLFIQTKMELTKAAEKSAKYKKYEVVDGVVFNFLFTKMKYSENYDAVKAVFPISYIFDDSRIEYLPEPQICVKNTAIISDLKKHSKETVPTEYEKFIFEYNSVKYALVEKKRLNKYKIKKSSLKYK